MIVRSLGPLLLIVSLAVPAFAQKRQVPANEAGWRVIAIDRVVTDAKTGVRKPAHCDGLTFVVHGYSKDFKHVLVEYTAPSRSAHAALLAEVEAHGDPHMAVWDKGSARLEEIEAAAAKAGFTGVDLRHAAVAAR